MKVTTAALPLLPLFQRLLPDDQEGSRRPRGSRLPGPAPAPGRVPVAA
ncbi:hypothetical protein SVIOM342S_06910 [Streptomyces violaceorubidus]